MVTNHAGHIGGAKVALPFANYIVCNFGATYMDGMINDPPSYFGYSKGT